MGTPLPVRRGTKTVRGDGGKADLAHSATINRVEQGLGQTSAAPHLSVTLTLRLAIWDERPWTDLPMRLAKDTALRLIDEESGGRADGLLIIRRWPTPVVLRRLAEAMAAARTPVLLCTAAPSEACAEALNLGIADILRDDMHHAEVMARVALRCAGEQGGEKGGARGIKGAQLAYGPLLLDRMQRMVWLHGRMLRLTVLQFDLLAALMQGAGEAVSADALRHAVWHSAHDPGTNRIAVHIHHIRRTLQDAGGGVAVEAAGGGYRLI